MIDSELVTATFKGCLFNDDEVAAGINEFTEARGVLGHVGFHPNRLEEQRAQVQAWLAQLPDNFKDGLGGGWSFLQMCQTADGEHWTGLPKVCDELVMMGIGLNLCSVIMREVAEALPGGVPYILIHSTD